jgi:hypothetical protein
MLARLDLAGEPAQQRPRMVDDQPAVPDLIAARAARLLG